jgi:2-methylcitrate dehydratase PrpD
MVAATKDYIVDYYAAALAGIRVNETFNRAMEDVILSAGGKEEASVLGSDRRLPVMDAAFMNAVYAHGADMDDGNRKAMGHVAAHVMSAVFALAETLGASGKDILVAVNAGYEVYNRIAAAVQPGLARRGFHSTGTAGAVACGAACAKLMGLDEKGIYNAMSLSAVQASGLLIITESGQACKPINPANAARAGILSAFLAARGVEAPVYPLESKKGWLHAMADQVDESEITETLGKVFTITESYLKPYPSCRHTHCGIECAFRIREDLLARYGRVSAEDMDRVEIHIYLNAINIAGKVITPKTSEESKFSIHYSLATALLKGHFDLDDLPVENVTEEVKALIGKIVFVEDETMENRKAGIRGSRVVVYTKDGATLEQTVLIPKGDASNPMTPAEMRAKFAACAGGLLSCEQQERLIREVDRFEDIAAYASINSFIK